MVTRERVPLIRLESLVALPDHLVSSCAVTVGLSVIHVCIKCTGKSHMIPGAGPSRGGFGILASLRSDKDPTRPAEKPAVREAPPQVKPPPPKPVATAPLRPQAKQNDMPVLLEPPGGFRSYVRSEAAVPAKPAGAKPLPKLAAKPARPQPPPAPQLPPQPAAPEAGPLPTLAARPARPQPPPAPEAPAEPAAARPEPEPVLAAKPEWQEPASASEPPAQPGAPGEPQPVPIQAQPKAAEAAEPQVPAAPEPPVVTEALPMPEPLPALAAKPARPPPAPEGKQPRPAEGLVPALQAGAPGAEKPVPATQPQPQLPGPRAGQPAHPQPGAARPAAVSTQVRSDDRATASPLGVQDMDSQVERAALAKRTQQAEQKLPAVPGAGPGLDRQAEQAAVARHLQSGQQVPASEAVQGAPEAEVPGHAPNPLGPPQPTEQPPALLPKPVRPPPKTEPLPVSQAPAGLQSDSAGTAQQGDAGSGGAAAASTQQAPAEVPQPGPALQPTARGLQGDSAGLEQEPEAGPAGRLAKDADGTGSSADTAAAEQQQSPALLPKPVRPVAPPQAPASSATEALESTRGASQAAASGRAGDAVAPSRPPAGTWLPSRDRPPQLLAKPARPPPSGAASTGTSSSRLAPQLGYAGAPKRAQRKQEQTMLLLDTMDAELAARRRARLVAVEAAARGIAGRFLPPTKGSDLGGVLSSTRAAEAGTQNEASLRGQAAEAEEEPRRWPQPGPRQQPQRSQPQTDGAAAAQPGGPAVAELEALLKTMPPHGEHQDGFCRQAGRFLSFLVCPGEGWGPKSSRQVRSGLVALLLEMA